MEDPLDPAPPCRQRLRVDDDGAIDVDARDLGGVPPSAMVDLIDLVVAFDVMGATCCRPRVCFPQMPGARRGMDVDALTTWIGRAERIGPTVEVKKVELLRSPLRS